MNVKRRSLGSLVREPIRNGKSAQTDPESKGVRVFTLTAVTKADFGEQNTKRSVLSDDDVQGIWAEPDDIFIQRSNTPELVGTAAIYNGPRAFAVYPDLLTRVRTNDSLRPRYLVLYLRSSWVRQYFQKNARGISGSMPKVSHQTINELPVPVPSLPEQDRIVAAIEAHFSRLDAAEQGLKRVRAKLKHARASVLKAAVEGRLVPTEAALARAEGRSYEPAPALLARVLTERRARWAERGERGQYKEPVAPEPEGLPELPEGWVWASLDGLAYVGTGATPNRSVEKFWTNGVVPWVTSSVVNSPVVTSASEFVSEIALRETNLTLYPAGTILLAMYGEGKTRGQCVVTAIPTTTNQALAAIQLCADDADLRSWILCALEHNYSLLRSQSSGGVQPNLNLSLVKGIKIPLPPLAEQARIVAEVDRRLSVLDQVEALVDRSLSRCASLRQSILKRAFEGRLVPPSAEVTPE
jgi:type I restriction enzyme S subunit